MKRLCSEKGCGRFVFARGLCKPGYARAYRAGEFEIVKNPLFHYLHEVDRVERTALCSRCGPTRIRVSGINGRKKTCWTVVEEGWARSVIHQQGLSTEGYAFMLQAQEHKCALCGADGVPLLIDHDHTCCPGKTSCGKCVRGLLCRRCNTGLGFFKDDLDMLARAAAYLAESRPNCAPAGSMVES